MHPPAIAMVLALGKHPQNHHPLLQSSCNTVKALTPRRVLQLHVMALKH
jgi:hypothetical protein